MSWMPLSGEIGRQQECCKQQGSGQPVTQSRQIKTVGRINRAGKDHGKENGSKDAGEGGNAGKGALQLPLLGS